MTTETMMKEERRIMLRPVLTLAPAVVMQSTMAIEREVGPIATKEKIDPMVTSATEFAHRQ
jgi:hypothetical protein